jgi:uncharacterized membrane protein
MALAAIRRFFHDERNINLVFEVSLWLKGVFALAQVAGGIAGFFVTRHFLLAFAQWVTRDEFAEDPHDRIANFLLHSAQGLSLGTQHFAAAYLLGHGIIKLWLIAGLLRRRLWSYPVAIGVFSLFIVYQVYRLSITGSPWLVLLSMIDLVVIVLTWHEWRYLRRAEAR